MRNEDSITKITITVQPPATNSSLFWEIVVISGYDLISMQHIATIGIVSVVSAGADHQNV